ncbi:Oxidoreductase [Frankia sp. Hr75.2]|nr:Oxidoreductase [Frankia sp. Hr75.2]
MAVGHEVVSTVGREELLDRARALVPALRKRQFETERMGRIPDETVEEIVAAGLTRAGVPVRFGGYDVEFETVHDIAMELGRACGATAWCYALWGMHSWWAGYYPIEAQEELFADGPDVLTSSANFSPDSRAEPTSGGYRVSGHWKFSSGIDHAKWLFAIIATQDGPMGAMVPRSDFTVDQDSWDVSGLQGSGSKDVVIDDAFVPAHRTLVGASNMFARQTEVFDQHPQRRYAVPRGALTIWELVAPAIGLAQGAIDEIVGRLTGTTGPLRSSESPLVQSKIAEAAAEVDAAIAILHTDMAEAQDKGARGEDISVLDLTRYARDKAYAMKLAVKAVNRIFDISGGRSLFRTNPLQRIHRDVQACMHRDGLMFDFSGLPYAQMRLGLEPTSVVRRGVR